MICEETGDVEKAMKRITVSYVNILIKIQKCRSFKKHNKL